MTPCCHDSRCWRCAGRGQGTSAAFHCCRCPPAQPSAQGFFSLPCCSHAHPWLRPCSHEHCPGNLALPLAGTIPVPQNAQCCLCKAKTQPKPGDGDKGVLESRREQRLCPSWDKPPASFHPARQGSDEGADTACQEQAKAELEHVALWQLLHATGRDHTVNVLTPTEALRVRRWLCGRKMT